MKNLNENLIMVVFSLSVLLLYFPWKFSSFLLVPAFFYIYKLGGFRINDRELKFILFLFLFYIFLFTLTSGHIGRSVKGCFDILRGVSFFWITLALIKHVTRGNNGNQYLLLNVFSVFLIAGNFFFQRGTFFGYHENPNNTSVYLVFLLLFVLPLVPFSRFGKHLLWVNALGVGMALYLLVLANSRGAWLGLTISLAMFFVFNKRFSCFFRLAMSASFVVGLGILVLFFNHKGFGLSEREGLWIGLFKAAIEEKPWFGFGLNTVKDVIQEHGLITHTAHNMFLEILVSSGIVGLIFMLFVFYRLARHLYSMNFRHNTVFWVGLMGLVTFLTMAQFDLKFSSFRFIATIFIFLGLIYSQRIPQQRSIQ